MSSGSSLNEQVEMLKALIELRVIKRDGMDLFFRLEDAISGLGSVRNNLLAGNKAEKEAGKKVSTHFSELYDLIYELQTLINIGEL